MKNTIKIKTGYLFSFNRLRVLDRLIIFLFEREGFAPTPATVNDQWRKGDLALVHDEEGWRIYDCAALKSHPLI
jgi:hypothetical protein